MEFFRRPEKKKITIPDSPKIKFDLSTFLFPILVFLANLFLVLPLFGRPLPQMSFATPLLPFLSGGKEEILRVFVLASYILGPVFLYFFVWEVTGRRLASLLASLIYTLPTFRLSQVFVFGDAAHIFALNIIPLILIYFLRFLRKLTVNLGIAVGLGIAIVALTSPFGLFTLLIFLMILTYSEMLLGQGRAKLAFGLLVLIAAAGLSAFWYHPGFVIKIFAGEQGKALLSILWSLVPPSFFLVPIFGAFSFLIFDRRPALQPIFLSLSSFFLFLLLVFVGAHISSAYVPTPSRFLPELSLATAFLSALVLVGISEILGREFVGKKLKLPLGVLPSIQMGFKVFISTLLVASIFFAHPFFWALAEGEVKGAQIGLSGNGGGISQVLGWGITLVTSFILVAVKLKVKIPRV